MCLWIYCWQIALRSLDLILRKYNCRKKLVFSVMGFFCQVIWMWQEVWQTGLRKECRILLLKTGFDTNEHCFSTFSKQASSMSQINYSLLHRGRQQAGKTIIRMELQQKLTQETTLLVAILGVRQTFSLLIMKSKLLKASSSACVWFRVEQLRQTRELNHGTASLGHGNSVCFAEYFEQLHSPCAFHPWCSIPSAAPCRRTDLASASRPLSCWLPFLK